MYEHRGKPLISRRAFLQRLAAHGIFVFALIFLSLLAGMIGYHGLAHMGWVDSFLNAAMIMGGMGPVDRLETEPAKIFAGFYALYSGLILLVSVGLLIAPVFHRMLHRFHWEAQSGSK